MLGLLREAGVLDTPAESASSGAAPVAPSIYDSEETGGIPPRLDAATWLASAASRGSRLLWFDAKPPSAPFALIPVSGISDNDALATLARSTSGTHWLNRRAALSEKFGRHRAQLGGFLGVALAANKKRKGERFLDYPYSPSDHW